ncbi:predicted protein [Sclerotinia sclerotiorum 1980 UF-70]|uniref:Uncharacterized protein n=1 Tax=Sclerotinia sclerotiorum (strain ATCC 18683 / 1980 / Ss-1) TaxID=665079 RepID=A7ESM8_SCLS1|nr:predicted protein [Sclerotinia sclerotiorum 1980 UF-70]EDN92470.1 predicted protein [Sclerotinia sclerotiorum 1980 UF-70]
MAMHRKIFPTPLRELFPRTPGHLQLLDALVENHLTTTTTIPAYINPHIHHPPIVLDSTCLVIWSPGAGQPIIYVMTMKFRDSVHRLIIY